MTLLQSGDHLALHKGTNTENKQLTKILSLNQNLFAIYYYAICYLDLTCVSGGITVLLLCIFGYNLTWNTISMAFVCSHVLTMFSGVLT